MIHEGYELELERRRYGSTTYTWVNVQIENKFRTSGDPFPKLRPSKADLTAAVSSALKIYKTENMKNKNSIALIKSAAATTAEKRGRVRLQPMNEGQEVNIVERFEGSAADIITRCLEIIRTLADLFPESAFTVKIEPFDLSDCFYVDEARIFDSNFNEVAPISHFNRHFNPQ